MSLKPVFAQYACDYCKRRKLACSREVPKCGNCRSCLGPCVYSRHGRIPRKSRSKITNRDTIEAHSKRSSSTTSSNLGSATSLVSPSPPALDQSNENRRNFDEAVLHGNGQHSLKSDGLSESTFPIADSPFLSQARTNITQLKNESSNPDLQSRAEDSLSELSNSFSEINFEDGASIQINVRNFRRRNEVFFIAEREEGLRLIDVFTDIIERGKPFFISPTRDILLNIVFKPSEVRERGWILLFNAIVSTNMSLMESSNTRLNRGLQWNTWMALEDSNIYINPSEINIQALMIVAAHGQEISTPSLCWTLISTACRMAQTLSLHLPTPNTPLDSDQNIHRNSLFWVLFILDKSLALAFGRPPLLPTYAYKHVPLPDPKELSKYRPHKQNSRHNIGGLDGRREEFGPIYVRRIRELAVLQGKVSDYLYRDRETLDETKMPILISELKGWIETTRMSIAVYETLPGDSTEKKSIKLGIDFLTFQYHHLMVFLTRSEKSYQSACLEAARSAIFLLDKLVSNSTEVFNGVVWQLLYSPFMPYFVVFANIISHPHSSQCFDDLKLLRQVVLYFLQMHGNHKSASKLERVAETFTKLAEAYVRHSMREKPNRSTATTAQNTVMQPTHPSEVSSVVFSGQFSQSFSSQMLTSTLTSSSSNDSPAFNLNDTMSNPMALLNFFSTPNFDGSLPASDIPMNPQYVSLKTFENNRSSDEQILDELETRAQNFALDGTFDWISWDVYDQDASNRR